MDTKVLNTEEELYILCQLKHLSHGDNGAARAVYFNVQLPFEVDTEYVVKLACGVGGFNQNQAEIKTWLEYGKSLPLARIIAYGKFVIIMERVSLLPRFEYLEAWDSDSYAELNLEWMPSYFPDQSEDDNIQLLKDMYCAAASLEEVFGATGDNDQLGMNAQKEVVAYDYGFYSDTESCQTTDITNEPGYIFAYLEVLILNYSCVSLDNHTLNKLENIAYYQADSGSRLTQQDESYDEANLDND